MRMRPALLESAKPSAITRLKDIHRTEKSSDSSPVWAAMLHWAIPGTKRVAFPMASAKASQTQVNERKEQLTVKDTEIWQPRQELALAPSQHACKATPTPAQPSASMLLNLPQEIRDIIYDSLFASIEVQLGSTGFSCCRKTTRHLAILFACRQTYTEALKPLYQQTVFHADDDSIVVDWLVKVPASTRPFIQCIRFSPKQYRYVYDDEDRRKALRGLIAQTVGLVDRGVFYTWQAKDETRYRLHDSLYRRD